MTPDSGELLRRDLEALARRLDKIDHTIESTDPNDPGHAIRLDRLERDFSALMRRLASVVTWIKWGLGGGFVGTASTIAFIIYLLRTLAEKSIHP